MAVERQMSLLLLLNLVAASTAARNILFSRDSDVDNRLKIIRGLKASELPGVSPSATGKHTPRSPDFETAAPPSPKSDVPIPPVYEDYPSPLARAACDEFVEQGLVEGCKPYTVKRHETLRTIAKRFTLPYQVLRALNPQLAERRYRIVHGLVINVPDGSNPAETPNEGPGPGYDRLTPTLAPLDAGAPSDEYSSPINAEPVAPERSHEAPPSYWKRHLLRNPPSEVPVFDLIPSAEGGLAIVDPNAGESGNPPEPDLAPKNAQALPSDWLRLFPPAGWRHPEPVPIFDKLPDVPHGPLPKFVPVPLADVAPAEAPEPSESSEPAEAPDAPALPPDFKNLGPLHKSYVPIFDNLPPEPMTPSANP